MNPIINIQSYVDTALPASVANDSALANNARQAVAIFTSNVPPTVAKDALLSIIRATWDMTPSLEADATKLIARYATEAKTLGGKVDQILNPIGSVFTPRQFLKFTSRDLAFLLAVTSAGHEVIETSLINLRNANSLTSWVSASYGFDATALINLVTARFGKGEYTPITKENTDMTTTTAAPATSITVDARMEPAVNAVLASAGVPTNIAALLSAMSRVTAAEERAAKSMDKISKLSKTLNEKADEISILQHKVKQAQSVSTTYTAPVSTTVGVPNGSCAMVMASTIFPDLKSVDFEIPAWTWAHSHPDVPAINDAYIFRKEMLVKFLLSLKRGDNTWFQGHTGSGKTTFVEQVAARLQWPVARIAFDSAIDRSELVGRMQLKSDGQGGTVSEWLKGVLELAIPNGYILLCDEFDAGRPDALYVLQEVLEHKAKRLLEDGGRFIDYHPMTRIVATGNTCGSGDPSGIYPATRILSGATLDRFPSFIHVPYMTEKEESDLIASATALSATLIKRMSKFSTEMRHAFVKAEIPISYSPRRSVAFARAVEDYLSVLGSGNEDKAMSLALQQTVYDASPEEFRQRIVEIARASLGGSINPTVSL